MTNRFARILAFAGGIILSCLPYWANTTTHAAEPASLDTRIADCCRKVLADPLDVTAANELSALRKEQGRQMQEAYRNLAGGLGDYIRGAHAAAARKLEKAAVQQEAVAFADATLLTPLSDLIKECRQKAGAGGPLSSPSSGVCAKCGETDEADCSACKGMGVLPCPTCKGQHTSRKPYGAACGDCTDGSRTCNSCGGRGIVGCTHSGSPLVPKPVVLGDNARDAFTRVIGQAEYFFSGGLDLDSPGALKCSPKLMDTAPAAETKPRQAP